MAEQSHILRISAKNTVPLKFTLIGTALLAFILSFMIMGTAFARMFVISYVALTALFLTGYAISFPSNWFEFDDDNKTIRKAFRNRISYDKIQAIVIAETPKCYTINVKTNWMPPYPIAGGLSKADAEYAEKEFKQRFPLDIIRRKSYSKKRFAIVMTIAGLIVITVFSSFLFRMYRLAPPEYVTAEKREWFVAKYPQEGAHYQINGIGFLLPNRFVQVKQDKGWIYFEDKTSKTKINVGPDNFRSGSIFNFLTRLYNDYDLLRLAYTTRYGIFPVFANELAFRDLFKIKVYEMSHGSLRGIVLQGIKGSKSVAQIVIAENERGIHFFMSQPGETGQISEEFLQSLVASIQSGI